MATKSTTAGTRAAKTTRSAKAEPAAKTAAANDTAVPVGEFGAETVAPVPKKQAREVDIHQYIPVRNGYQGLLVYISKRSGEEFQWERFGDEQEMELQELKNAKSTNKSFFEQNWFMFDDDYLWVPEYLGVGAYYKNALKLEEFDQVFTMTPDEIYEKVSKLSAGQKASLAIRAGRMIADNEIDSNRVIAALEDALGERLAER